MPDDQVTATDDYIQYNSVFLAQEMQLWMPNGDQGNGNLPTLQQYVNNAVRIDGALHSSIADCKSYNKCLQQLTKMMVGVAQFIVSNGIAITDDMTPTDIQHALQEAIAIEARKVKTENDFVTNMLSED